MSISEIENLPTLRAVVEQHGLWADKAFGQNYLFDINLTRKIARIPKDTKDLTIFEIGPGPGGLTRALLLETQASRVVAIEKDRRFIEALQPLIGASDNRLSVVEGDALKADLIALSDAPRAVMANLPYNVGTELLISWLHRAPEFRFFTLMFQREVAERLVAKPDTKAYGRLSVLAQALCDVKIAMNVPNSAFTPPPKVTSSVVHLIPKENAKDIPVAALEKITAAAFGQRRKMLRQSMKAYLPILEKCHIDPQSRAEDLTVAQYIDLALKS
jgi:16S rRNA (adenine1518-N6/adenine1519-N6)-dimethyltransferase